MSPLLAEIDRFRNRLLLGRGVNYLIRLLLAAGGGAALAVAVDWKWHLEPAARLCGGIVYTAFIVWGCWKCLFYLYELPQHRLDMAQALLKRDVELPQEFLSAVEFLDQGAGKELGSPLLQSRVIEQVSTKIHSQRWAALFHLPRWNLYSALGGLFLIIGLVGCWFSPLSLEIAWVRWRSPTTPVEWPLETRLVWLDPRGELFLDRRLNCLTGQPVTVKVSTIDGELPSNLELRWYDPDGHAHPLTFTIEKLPRTAIRKNSDVEEAFREVATAKLAPTRGPVQVRAVGGDDDRLTMLLISVAPLPTVAQYEYTSTYPRYTHKEPEAQTSSRGEIQSLVGTKIKLWATTNVPLQRVSARTSKSESSNLNEAGDLLPLSNDGLHFEWEGTIEAPGVTTVHWEMTDRHGLRPPVDPTLTLRGVEDRPPTVTLEQPGTDLHVTTSARVPLKWLAEDDWGLTQTRLVYTDASHADNESSDVSSLVEKSLEQPPGLGERQQRVSTEWDLAPLSLSAGQTLYFAIEATDNRHRVASLPQIGRSVSRQLFIVSPEEKLKEISLRRRSLAEALRQSQSTQERLSRLTGELQTATGGDPQHRASTADRLTQVAQQQSQLNEMLFETPRALLKQVVQLQAEFKDNHLNDPTIRGQFDRLATELAELRTGQSAEVLQSLTEVRREFSAPSQQQELATTLPWQRLRETEQAQRDIADRLGTLLDWLGDRNRREEVSRSAQEIAESQRELMKETERLGSQSLSKPVGSLTPAEQSDLNRLVDRQTRVRQQVERWSQQLKELATHSRQQSGSAPNASPENTVTEEDAADLAEIAKNMERQDLAGKLQEAADQLRRQNLGRATAAQTAAAEGLEEILHQLRQDPESDFDSLVKRVDQSREEMNQLGQAEIELMKRAKEVSSLTADAGQKRERQELTRQQRELADRVKTLSRQLQRRDWRSPAASTSRAAEEMRTAADRLENPGEVGEPTRWQQESVSDLEQAAHDLDQVRQSLLLQQTAQRLQHLHREAALLAARQQRLLDETQRLDEQQQAAGHLSRSQLISLQQTAESQRGLSADLSALSTTWSSAPLLGSIFKDASNDMLTAADRLKARQTDAVTQSSQSSSLHRLQELQGAVENLFEGEASGKPGEGKESQPNSPESLLRSAEMRLLTAMQRSLNQQTDDLIKAAKPLAAAQETEADKLTSQQQHLAEEATRLLTPLTIEKSSTDEEELAEQGTGDRGQGTGEKKDPTSDSTNDEAHPAPVAESPARLARQIMSGMESAQSRLSQRRLDQTTQEIQQRVLAKLEGLLKQSSSNNQQTPASEESMANAQNSGENSGTNGTTSSTGGPRKQDDSQAANSTEETGATSAQVAAALRRRQLTDAVWGHLPPKLREELHRNLNERDLPDYAPLVRRYYEALAEQAK